MAPPLTVLTAPADKFSRGFTLIELMVVIAIIAILATIDVAFYANAQRNARDSQRKTEVESIAHSIESSKPSGSTTYLYSYTNLKNDFPAGLPLDPLGSSKGYCIAVSTTQGSAPADATTNSTSGCPTGGASYVATGSGLNIPSSLINGTAYAWSICASLENSPNPFCIDSANK